MISPETLKPYLLHEDREIRSAVVDYFEDSCSQDPELMPMILEACHRYGPVPCRGLLSHSYRFPVSEPAFDDVLRLLDEVEDSATIHHLSRIISYAPLELLRKHEDLIRKKGDVGDDFHRRIEQSLEFGSWSGERLWAELQAFSDRSKDAHHSGEIDHVYADALVEAMARHDVPDAETVHRLLTTPEIEGQWLELFLIKLAGERRLTETVPALVERFHVDTDYMLELCCDALAKIGDVRAIYLIRDAFPSASWNFKNYTSSLLCRFKHPDAEDAIIALLEGEEDIEIQTELCYSLCRLFSERGVEVVRRQIHSGYDELMVCLEETLLPVIDVLGIDLPEAPQWRRERKKRERAFVARQAELERLGNRYAASKKQKVNSWDSFANAEPQDLEKPVPYQRHDAKVGRNDPCPCGSGKKYKRCCGR